MNDLVGIAPSQPLDFSFPCNLHGAKYTKVRIVLAEPGINRQPK